LKSSRPSTTAGRSRSTRRRSARTLPTLGEREREVLRLRFAEELPQTEIAARIGCSQMHVSRLLRRSLDQLREEAERDPRSGEAEAAAA
jgi:RNA polymerase sigma factor (sigma-70 family)